MRMRPMPRFETWLKTVKVTDANRKLLRFLGTVGGNTKLVLAGIDNGDCVGAPEDVCRAAKRLHRRYFEASGSRIRYDDYSKKLMKHYPYEG